MVSPSSPGLPANPFEGVAWDNTLGALLIGGLLSGMSHVSGMDLVILDSSTFSRTNNESRQDIGLFRFRAERASRLSLSRDKLYEPPSPDRETRMESPRSCPGHGCLRVAFGDVSVFLSHQSKLLTAGILATSLLDLREPYQILVYLPSLTMRFLLASVVGIIIAAKGFQLESIDQLSKLKTLFYINFASGTGSDVYVAGVLCYFLHTSRTGFNTRTDSIISILMLYTINTGLLTAIDAFMGMILTDLFLLVYSNAYLATLNNRGALREKSSTDGIVSIHLSQLGAENGTSHGIGTWIHGRTRSEADTRNDYPKRSAEPLEVVIQRSSEVSVEEGRGKDTTKKPLDDKWAARSPA
ncbi:hypothetical protein EVG20_g7301 [Dentipellis fragilis]|uniref:DUF6534 domain-containing protein n=1 Tax=Dentipellis fragilis TaxID=205917 RepID=A0A4Y9YGD6_9AGAM|nr:hypothetical protein EVG20_g7301 [Dentipellis fragilis]